MHVAKKYSYHGGLRKLMDERPEEMAELLRTICDADPADAREETGGRTLYSPQKIAKQMLEDGLHNRGWLRPKTTLEDPENIIYGDALKNGVGLELQFSSLSFLGWDSLRKMAIFANNGVYKYGVEVAPTSSLRRNMGRGIGSYEQIVERLQKTGNPELKIPTLILGIDA
jgi:hypothetical protein